MRAFNVFTAIMNGVTAPSDAWAAKELLPLLEWRAELQPRLYRFVLESLVREVTDESRVRTLFLLRFLDGESAYGLDPRTLKETAETIMDGRLLNCSTDTDGASCASVRIYVSAGRKQMS